MYFKRWLPGKLGSTRAGLGHHGGGGVVGGGVVCDHTGGGGCGGGVRAPPPPPPKDGTFLIFKEQISLKICNFLLKKRKLIIMYISQ